MSESETRTITVPASMASFFEAVLHERNEQDAQWGGSDHDPIFWMAIIGKHVGRAHSDTLDGLALLGNDSEEFISYMQFTQRLIVIGALCCAAVESMNRGVWRWPGGNS